MQRPTLVIVCPALGDVRNGNWQTAQRWARWLARAYRVQVVTHWRPDTASPDTLRNAHTAGATPLMIALHARRSAPSITAWAAEHQGRGLAVALTGTDLYRDIAHDPEAQRSLALAQRLVVLQSQGPAALPAEQRHKAVVLHQSTTPWVSVRKTSQRLRALMVGHLRAEKDPATYWQAAAALRGEPRIRLDHIGAALEPAWATQAESAMVACPHYRWLGALPHNRTRQRIQRAHVLVHPSQMEGGAHVIMEAACSGTPVLASRIEGNIGMLGSDYAGYFDAGDATGLAQLLRQCLHTDLLATLQAQCALRAPLFTPEAEQAGLLALCQSLQTPP